MEIFVVSLLLIVFVILAVFKWNFNYWKRKGVYTLTPSIPFGNAKNTIMQKCCIGLEIFDVYNHLKKKSLSFGGFYFMTLPILIPVDLELIKKILITDFDHFTNHPSFSEDYDPLSKHLFSLKGTEWKKLRSKLTPAFSAPKNKMVFETMLKCVDELLIILDNSAEKNEKIDVFDLTTRLAMDVIASCAFGIEADALNNPNSEIRKRATEYLEPSIRNTIVLLLVTINPKLLSFFRITFTSKNLTNFFMNLTEKTVSYREANKVIRKDFMHLLLQIKNNELINDDAVGHFEKTNLAPQLTLEEMAAQSLVFFVGGFETISTTIMYCLYELAKNTTIQEKARAEVQKCLLENSENDTITYALLQKLSYLDQIVHETLRLNPPAPILMRQCTKDYKIPNSDLTIKKGDSVIISSLGIHTDPDIYPNPNEFDPERFSPENVKNRPSCSWLPFGDGPRTCIGQHFALMEVRAVVATLLNRYRFTVNSEPDQSSKLTPSTILLLPSGKIWLNIERL